MLLCGCPEFPYPDITSRCEPSNPGVIDVFDSVTDYSEVNV